jgi:hypothetical protein
MNNFDDILNNAPEGEQTGRPLSKEEYAAKKHAQREAIFELSDSAALNAAGDGTALRLYLDVQAKFDRYSAVNALLITAQKPGATQLGDFEHWKSRGGFVRPGQTGISILEPQEYTKEDGTPGVGYNVKKVFDVSQIDARKVRQTQNPNYTDRQILSALISKAPVKITGVDELPDGGGAATDPGTGEIHVLKGMGFADTFRSVTHELACAEAIGRDGNTDPAFTAYCASYLLCVKYGADTRDYSFESAPAQFADMDAQAVKHELSGIRDIAENISSRMAKQLDAVSKAAPSREAR